MSDETTRKLSIEEATIIDVLNRPWEINIKCRHPDELMLIEYREDEFHSSGLILMAVSTQKFGQVDVIPKWKVLAVGDNVFEKIGVKVGELVIVPKYAGKLRNLGKFDVRIIHRDNILAKAIYEHSDFVNFVTPTNSYVNKLKRELGG